MTINDFSGPREYRGTIPRDPKNPARFGQLIETVKDAFAAELYRFFEFKSEDVRAKLREFPAIEKFGVGAGSTSSSMETVMNLIMSYGDTPDKYPMIAITSASSRELVLGLGSTQVCSGQDPVSVVSTNSGPYILEDEWTLILQTWPQGLSADPVVSTLMFTTALFSNIANATVDEVASAINMQALYSNARVSSGGYLQIMAGGPCAPSDRNGIEIVGGTAECLSALGFIVGQQDLYTSHTAGSLSPVKRHGVAGKMTINLDVVSDDMNTRTQLADLVQDFFTFYSDRNFFQFQGRSYLETATDPPEWYQIIFDRSFSWSGEYNRPRQGGEQKSYLYSIRGSVPVTAVDFVNRPVNRSTATFIQSATVVRNDDLPDGDYPGISYVTVPR